MGNSYEDLEVWQLAVDLVTEVYSVTKHFPPDERFGLTTQLRRAAVSIPSNIAEGQGRTTARDFHLFLGHAHGSVMEVETQLIIASKLKYVDQQRRNSLLHTCGRVKQMLFRLMQAVTLPTSKRDIVRPSGERETGNGERL